MTLRNVCAHDNIVHVSECVCVCVLGVAGKIMISTT